MSSGKINDRAVQFTDPQILVTLWFFSRVDLLPTGIGFVSRLNPRVGVWMASKFFVSFTRSGDTNFNCTTRAEMIFNCSLVQRLLSNNRHNTFAPHPRNRATKQTSSGQRTNFQAGVHRYDLYYDRILFIYKSIMCLSVAVKNETRYQCINRTPNSISRPQISDPSVTEHIWTDHSCV